MRLMLQCDLLMTGRSVAAGAGLFLVLVALLNAPVFAQSTAGHKFVFGPGNAPAGYTRVQPADKYTKEKGYGFDLGTVPVAVGRNGKDPLVSGFCTSGKSFYFSVSVPEGNYDVTVTLGDIEGVSATTVRAESRRLMLEKIVTEKGKTETCRFTVNMRVPEIYGTGGKVALKPRESKKLDWDDKLTFEFADKLPCLCSLEITPSKDAVTVYIAGDSTVVDQEEEPWASWGQMFPKYFKHGVSIANHAESGLSLGSFQGSRHLEKVLSTMKQGDYLLIEFGHNDQKEKGTKDGAYKSYSERLRYFISEVRKKGGIPVVVTSANRRRFDDDDRIIDSLGDYPDAAIKVAKEEGAAVIDLNAMTKVLYETLGPDNSKKAFVIYPAGTWPGQTSEFNDNTHFNSYGAYELAKCIVEGVKANNLSIAKSLIDGVKPFDPAAPDPWQTFSLPLSPLTSVDKPDGN